MAVALQRLEGVVASGSWPVLWLRYLGSDAGNASRRYKIDWREPGAGAYPSALPMGIRCMEDESIKIDWLAARGEREERQTDHRAMSKPFHVAIIGGGIAGLTLAIALHHRQVPFTIYEQAGEFGEVGAGVSFTPNAVQAMKACHPGIYEALERVCTRNLWPSKQNVWFDYLDGFANRTEGARQPIAFTIRNSLGQNGVHRAHFLAELVQLLPADVARFNKHLDSVGDNPASGRRVCRFSDGSSAEADVVIGCDGIKSRVRALLLGDDLHPAASPSFTHKYAYRGLVPMDKAVAAVGEELASNSCMHVCIVSCVPVLSVRLCIAPAPC